MAAPDRANDPKRVPFINGVRVTPANSHFEGSKWAPAKGEGIVPGGKNGTMIAESVHEQNKDMRKRAIETFNKRAREEGKTKIKKIGKEE